MPGPEDHRDDDAYAKTLDAELARMDERPASPFASALDRGPGAYLRTYARSVLPLAIVLGAVRALEGASVVQVTLATLAALTVGGLVSLFVASFRRRMPRATPAKLAPPAPAFTATAAHEDARDDARLDEELRKLDA
jgi:hypothetical protein